MVFGYSLAFTGGSTPFIGGFSKAFLSGVTPDSKAATFSVGVDDPEMLYLCFQMTFAAITPALIVGSLVERMKFSADGAVPAAVGHCSSTSRSPTWSGTGPARMRSTRRESSRGRGRRCGQDRRAGKLDEVHADAGLIFSWGAIDFAGGTVVHINAGIAGLVGAILVGKRIGAGKDLMPPHSLVMNMIGGALLWVGWFGFNAGSNLEASGGAILAMAQHLRCHRGRGSRLDVRRVDEQGQALAARCDHRRGRGSVAVTPASGFAGPMGRSCSASSPASSATSSARAIKHALGYDDSLDVFGVHCVGGVIGAILTGILVNPSLGGTGIMNYDDRQDRRVRDVDADPRAVEGRRPDACCGRASAR